MVQDVQLRVLPRVAATPTSIREQVVQELGAAAHEMRDWRVIRRSIDARQRQVMVNLTVRVWLGEEPTSEYPQVDYPDVSGRPQVIVVGAGPGGLFAALRLIELGLRPIVLERGKDVHERKLDLARISREHSVNPESNYSFGEGGAGAYSDGKLYTRSKKRGSVDRLRRRERSSGSARDDAHAPRLQTESRCRCRFPRLRGRTGWGIGREPDDNTLQGRPPAGGRRYATCLVCRGLPRPAAAPDAVAEG